MSSRYSDDKRKHHSDRDERDRHRSRISNYEQKNHSRSRSRSCSRSRSRSRSKSPDYRHIRNSGSSSSSYNRNSHHRNVNSGRNGLSSVYGRNDEHKSRDADDSNELLCPPPPVISKVSLSLGKSQKPAKPVQLKLAANKPSEPVKKLSVASAFSNNDSSDDDDEEEIPMKYSRNIGRDTPTSSGPNSFGKTKQGFCDVKKIFEKSLREFSDD